MKITNTTILFILFLVGCANTRTISVNELASYNQYDLKVFVNDGKVIQYSSSNYEVDSTNSDRMIKGSGLVIADNVSTRNYRNTNSISYSKIDSVQISEYDSVSKGVGLGIAIASSASMALVILYLIFGPRSIG